jgi:hypothetical protein
LEKWKLDIDNMNRNMGTKVSPQTKTKTQNKKKTDKESPWASKYVWTKKGIP